MDRKMTDNLVSLRPCSVTSFHGSNPPHQPLTVEHHDDTIPPHAEQLLHSLYGNVHSSMPHFKIYGGLDGASTFILRAHREPIAIFLFRIEGNNARVLNEGMETDERAVTQFADFIFRRYESVDFISFTGIACTSRNLAYPVSQCFCNDDSVISLPDSPEDYLKSLGKATRKNIKQYLSRIQRDYPSFEFRVHDGRTAEEQLIRKVVELNRIRFGKKGKVSGITEEEEERIIGMVRECGMIGSIWIDGKFCGGSLVYRIGEHYHSWLKAHDPAYDDYRLGLIGSFLMISECISRGGKSFHLMWGREPHKALLNSELRVFSSMTVYRNHAATVRNCRVMFRHVYQHRMRQGKLWLLEMEKAPGKISYPIKAGLNGVRKIKAWLPR